MRQNKETLFCVLLTLFAVVFDQATKLSVLAFLPANGYIKVFEGFNIVLTFNSGTSFGLLSPKTVFGYYMIIGMTILCMIFLTYMFFKLRVFAEKVFCALILGGALGNLADRFIHGAVVDFLDVYYKNLHWPAFNFADMFISCGAIFLILYNLFCSKEIEKKQKL